MIPPHQLSVFALRWEDEIWPMGCRRESRAVSAADAMRARLTSSRGLLVSHALDIVDNLHVLTLRWTLCMAVLPVSCGYGWSWIV